MSGNLTEHFSFLEFCNTDHAEFQARNIIQGDAYRENMTLVCLELEKLRAFIQKPIIINSGFRCLELNRAVGGVDTSQHTVGGAADFTVRDYNDRPGLSFIFQWLGNHSAYGQLILEMPDEKKPWIHLGIPREGRARTRYTYERGVYRAV